MKRRTVLGMLGSLPVGQISSPGQAESQANVPYHDYLVDRLAKITGRKPQRWQIEQAKDQLHHVPYLDPDLAALKSMSEAVKIGIQRQRNIDNWLNREERELRWNLARTIWERTIG